MCLSARGHRSTLSAGWPRAHGVGSAAHVGCAVWGRARGVLYPSPAARPARSAAAASVLQPREKGRMRFHRLQNVQIALDFLKQRQVRAAREHDGYLVI